LQGEWGGRARQKHTNMTDTDTDTAAQTHVHTQRHTHTHTHTDLDGAREAVDALGGGEADVGGVMPQALHNVAQHIAANRLENEEPSKQHQQQRKRGRRERERARERERERERESQREKREKRSKSHSLSFAHLAAVLLAKIAHGCESRETPEHGPADVTLVRVDAHLVVLLGLGHFRAQQARYKPNLAT
jgi:hypothetical protein